MVESTRSAHLVHVNLVERDGDARELERLHDEVEEVLDVLVLDSRRQRSEAGKDVVIELEARGLLLMGADDAPLEDALDAAAERRDGVRVEVASVHENRLDRTKAASAMPHEQSSRKCTLKALSQLSSSPFVRRSRRSLSVLRSLHHAARSSFPTTSLARWVPALLSAIMSCSSPSAKSNVRPASPSSLRETRSSGSLNTSGSVPRRWRTSRRASRSVVRWSEMTVHAVGRSVEKAASVIDASADSIRYRSRIDVQYCVVTCALLVPSSSSAEMVAGSSAGHSRSSCDAAEHSASLKSIASSISRRRVTARPRSANRHHEQNHSQTFLTEGTHPESTRLSQRTACSAARRSSSARGAPR